MIRAVSFDVGGTLIRPWPSVGHVYAEVAAHHGVRDLSADTLNKGFLAAWRARRHFQHTREDWARLVEQTFAGTCPPDLTRQFFPALYQRFAEPDAWRIYDDVLPALDSLASMDIPLAVISNWDERLRPLLRELRLDGYFESIIVSCEIGFAKPSPVIFEQAEKKIGSPPAQILHVGDDPVDDVAGAKAAGYQALLINRHDRTRDPEHIHSLESLASLLTHHQ
jgi:putative hydrolase of the HAD superfamily